MQLQEIVNAYLLNKMMSYHVVLIKMLLTLNYLLLSKDIISLVRTLQLFLCDFLRGFKRLPPAFGSMRKTNNKTVI